MAGIPAWAVALAAPYGLQKFVVEPAQGIYTFSKGIYDDVRNRTDNELASRYLKRISTVRNADELAQITQELARDQELTNATLTKQLIDEAKNTGLAINKQEEEAKDVADITQFAQDVSKTGLPVDEYITNNFGNIPWRALQKFNDSFSQVRQMVENGAKRALEKQKEANLANFQSEIADLTNPYDEKGNVIPYHVKMGQVLQAAARHKIDADKALKDFVDLYSKQYQPKPDIYNLGGTKVVAPKTLFGNPEKVIQDVAPKTFNNINLDKGGVDLRYIRKPDGRWVQVNAKTREGYNRLQAAIKNGELVLTADQAFPPARESTQLYDAEKDMLRTQSTTRRQLPPLGTTRPPINQSDPLGIRDILR